MLKTGKLKHRLSVVCLIGIMAVLITGCMRDSRMENKADNELYVGITYNNIPLIKQALEEVEDKNWIRSIYGNVNPLYLAYEKNADDDVKKLLKDSGVKMTGIKDSEWFEAASNAEFRIINEMAEGGFDMRASSPVGVTAYSAVMIGNNTDYDTYRTLKALHENGYEPDRYDILMSMEGNSGLKDSYHLKSIREIVSELSEMGKQSWIGKQIADECLGNSISMYESFSLTDISLIAAFGDSSKLKYAIEKAGLKDIDINKIAAEALRCGNVETFGYLRSIGAKLEEPGIVYECMAEGYDSAVKAVAENLGISSAKTAWAITVYFNNSRYIKEYIAKYGLTDADQYSMILEVNTEQEAEWLKKAPEFGYDITKLNGNGVKAAGTFVYIEAGGDKQQALEGCLKCRECYGSAEFLEKLVEHGVDISGHDRELLNMAVSGGHAESAEWLIRHGAILGSDACDAPYVKYNTDEIMKIIG